MSWGIMAKDLNKGGITAHEFNKFGNAFCGAVHAGVAGQHIVVIIPAEERKCKRCQYGNGV